MTYQELVALFPMGCRVRSTQAALDAHVLKMPMFGTVRGYSHAQFIRVQRDGFASKPSYAIAFWERTDEPTATEMVDLLRQAAEFRALLP